MTATITTYHRLHAVLVDLDVAEHQITPDAALRADLDVDSAELVEIVTQLASVKVDGKALKSVRTVAELVTFLDTCADRTHPEVTGEEHTMHHTEHAITVDAPQRIVWEVLADIEGYAKLFPPTRSSTLLEEGEGYQIARLVVDVSGEEQSWTTRRDLDVELGVIAYRQLQTAPLVGHMAGEWRAFPFGPERTQLVLTHDFAARQEGADGMVAGHYTHAEAHELLAAAVERNSVADLAAVRDESERRAVAAARTA